VQAQALAAPFFSKTQKRKRRKTKQNPFNTVPPKANKNKFKHKKEKKQ
jgi:hypothetical protein